MLFGSEVPGQAQHPSPLLPSHITRAQQGLQLGCSTLRPPAAVGLSKPASTVLVDQNYEFFLSKMWVFH